MQVQGTATIANGTTLVLSATPFSTSGTLVVTGTLRLLDGAAPNGSGSYVYDAATGTLEFAAQSSPYVIGAGGYWPP